MRFVFVEYLLSSVMEAAEPPTHHAPNYPPQQQRKVLLHQTFQRCEDACDAAHNRDDDAAAHDDGRGQQGRRMSAFFDPKEEWLVVFIL